MNISMIMAGIDPQTKKFTEPPEQIKKQIADLKGDKSVPEAKKKEELAQLDAALKNVKPVQFKENIALVLKNYDKLAPLMEELGSGPRPASSSELDCLNSTLDASWLVTASRVYPTCGIFLMQSRVLPDLRHFN